MMNVSRVARLVIGKNIKPSLKTPLSATFSVLKEAQRCNLSNFETKNLQKDDNLVKRVLKKIPFLNVNKTRLAASSYFLYEHIADKVDYLTFFEELNLPDTFYSWFVITELHIWMLSVRAMAEGDDGRLIRNYLVEALWNDVAQRIKKLGTESNPSVARQQVSELSEQLQAALIAYDEGLQSDDVVLAGALWRRFYQQSDIGIENLDLLIRYIRKQMRILDNLSQDSLFSARDLNWIDLKQI